jgi:23S rRNA (cytosine1962-C5)-methyltransferase
MASLRKEWRPDVPDYQDPNCPTRLGSQPVQSRLRLHVSAAAQAALRAGHPWLFADSIRQQNRQGNLGDLAAIYDRHDRFLGIGLFDPDSPMRVRMLHVGKPLALSAEWWRSRWRQARARRESLFDEQTTGFRWVHGESDGFPGLVLDRYGTTLVIKLYTAAWFPHWPEVLRLIREEFHAARIVLRLSRNIQVRAQAFNRNDGQVVLGAAVEEPVIFLESGLRFEADVLRGQKTGFFLDQRENRRRVESLARGREVLNVFSFSGGFSLYAARGGARSVLDVDLSSHALEAAQRNFARNRSHPNVRACRHEALQADALEWLSQQSERPFDLVILDPPSLARRESERAGALAAYARLARGALERLRSGGILVAASCSAHVSASEFFECVRVSVRDAKRLGSELATTLQPPDHPATFPEAEYLKCIYFNVT